MNLYRKLGKTASVLFLALAMAGCGGGDDGPTPEQTAALEAAQRAAAMAAAAAKTAADAAAAKVEEVKASANADAAAYQEARDAAEDAMDAYMTAKAASDAAAGVTDATMAATAEGHQAAAEAAQAAAETARDSAVMYANQVAQAEADRLAAEEAERQRLAAIEAADLLAAQTAAAAAATAAETASNAAQAAVEAAMDGADADPTSYAAAQAAAQAAMDAYMAASAASAAAADAETSDEAERQQEIAEAAQDDAEDAKTRAMDLAAMVNTAHAEAMAAAERERMALEAARAAAATAAESAKTASAAAAAAVMAVESMKDADATSYALAQTAAEAAMEAYMEASAASDAAAAADNSAEAERQRDIAEDAQDDAEDARDNAMSLADMVSDAHDAAVEMAAVEDARTKANAAAADAQTAADEARAAANMAEELDPGSQAAMDAKAAADQAGVEAAIAQRAADAAAMEGISSGDAMARQMEAEDARDEAQAQRTSALAAQMVAQGNKDDRDAAEKKRMDLETAQGKAMDAATKARTAADAARDAAAAIALIADVDDQAVDDARAAARRALVAAALAEDASDRAQMATEPDVAQEEQRKAELQQGLAEEDGKTATDLLAEQEMLADQRQKDEEAEMERETKIANAKGKAKEYADAAREDAVLAQEEADKAAKLHADMPDEAISVKAQLKVRADQAQQAADDADAAASRAEDALADANAVTGNDEAAVTAAEQARDDAMQGAVDSYAELGEAKRLATESQQLADAAAGELERIALAAAKKAANDAATAAMGHYETAKSKAESARTQAMMARAAANRAASARTNAEEAGKQATLAETAATAAEAARDAAETAKDDAQAAATSADGAADSTAAKGFQTTAETERDTAETESEKADTQYMAANTAREGAERYEKDHVVGLLMMANAEHIITAADPDANLDETELELIRKNVNAHIANVNTAVKAANDDIDPADLTSGTPHHGGGTVAATWSYYTSLGTSGVIGGTGDEADTGPGEGKPMITVTPDSTGGSPVALQHAGPGADGNAGTADDLMDNFDQGPGLGVFTHEKYISGLDTTTTAADLATDPDALNDFNTQRIILFTDKEQGSAGIPPETVSYFGEPVVASRIATVNTATPVEDTERDYNATYDHDGNEATDPIAVVLNCGTNCNLRVTNREIVSISGYTFSTAGDVQVPAVAPVEDDTWLAFGVWLTETVVADGTNTYVFGAFADGGAAIGDTGEPSAVASVTGDATYTGKAAGVHSTATEVEFFHGDATLNAKFGDGTAIGTITGMIHNIMSGGRPVGQDIQLRVADPGAATPSPNIVDAGTFGGRARMHDTGENDSSGEDIYRYTGGWSGTFYNHMADVDRTTEDVAESTRAPGSVAGTFGVGRADDGDTMDVNETESYVGAFGAHCSGTNCNPHDE